MRVLIVVMLLLAGCAGAADEVPEEEPMDDAFEDFDETPTATTGILCAAA